MKKMSINDAAEYFGVSKEAIHNRIRRGSLEVHVENGLKMVMIDSDAKASRAKPKNSVKEGSNNERYYKLLEEQNTKLQSRVETLEGETRSLRDQKEIMLINERKKIEQIYKDKDEQLKNILGSLSSQFTIAAPIKAEEEMLEAEIEEVNNGTHISLKKYLKQINVSDKKRDKIKKRFVKKSQKDKRIIIINDKYYIDTAKYDYSDLIK